MTDDLVLCLPVGARAVVVGGLRLGEQATTASVAAASELTRTIAAWSGPGAVVVAGDLFDCAGTPAAAKASLDAHPGLRDAFALFAAGPGRHVVLLPGTADAWLGCSVLAADAVVAATGALVAPALVLELAAAVGTRSVRVEAGRDLFAAPSPGQVRVATAGAATIARPGGPRVPAAAGGVAAGTDPAAATLQHQAGRQRLAEVIPGVWKGGTSGWLAGLSQLDDPAASPRFVASRLVYRQFAKRAWLLLLPVAVAMLARLPLALLRPAHKVAGPLLETAVGAAALELVVLLALAAASVRQVWLAFSGRTALPADLNEPARANARQVVHEGLTGLVSGGTGRAELVRVGRGFYANVGACCDVVSEYPPRSLVLGLPSPFLATRRLGWLELEAGADLHARLLFGHVLVEGATLAERAVARVPGLTARGPMARQPEPVPASGPGADRATRADSGGPVRHRGPVPLVVATFPNGPSWPEAPAVNAPHRRSRRLAAVVVAAAGLVSVLSALSAPVAHRLDMLRQVLPLAVPQAAGALTALGGTGLLMLARGIRRGQRRAYLVCQAVLLSVAVLHFLKAGSIPGALVALVVAAFLWARRGSFRAASDLPPLRRGLVRLAGVAALAVLAGTLTLEGSSWFSTRLHHRHVARIGWGQAFLATVERMVALTHVPLPGRLDDFFTVAMSSITAGLTVAAAWMLFRPVVDKRARSGGGGVERARELVRRHGGGTLDYFSLRSDKKFFFWADTLVAYAVYGGVCLVSPDPVGPVVQREAAWRAFRQYADGQGWVLAVLGASEDWLPVYRSNGMHDLYVGDEAVVRVGEFSLEGGKFKGLRQAVKRVARYGYSISFHDPATVPRELAAELEAVMTKSRRGGVERGFSMTLGRIFDPSDQGLLLAVVHGPLAGAEDAPAGPAPPHGAPAALRGGEAGSLPGPGAPARCGAGPAVAFCQYVPAPAIEGFSLDLMRRDNAEHPNGLIDFAIVETVRYLGERGYKGLGLNFATMRAVLAGETGDGVTQKAQSWLLKRMSGSMQIESLWRFNAKFDPIWQPRYVVYDSAEHAVAVAVAVARAESFWELPVIGRFLVPPRQRGPEATVPTA